MKIKSALLILTILFICQDLRSQTLSDGLQAFYPFDDDASDYSLNSNNGNVHGATPTSDRFGNPNSAFKFSGDDWIQVDHSPSINFSINQEYSFSLWFKFDGDSDGGTLLSKWVNSFDPCPYTIRGNNANHIISAGRYIGGLPMDSTTSQYASYESIPESDTLWHHIAAVYTTDTIYFYFDNALVDKGVNTLIDGDVANQYDLYIGRRANREDRYFKGKLDDIRIYNRRLTRSEVRNLFYENVCFETVTEVVYDSVLTEIIDTTFVELLDTTYVEVFDTTHIEVIDTTYIAVADTLYINYTVLGVEDSMDRISIYPNPALNTITVDFGTVILDNYRIRIVNSVGSEVLERSFVEGKITIDLADWGGAGVYYLNIIDHGGLSVSTKKILLK